MRNPNEVTTRVVPAQRTGAERDWPANFKDRLTAPMPRFRDVLRMLRQGGPRARNLDDVPRIPVDRHARLPSPEPGQAVVTWAGHASYVIQLGGLTVLTDPVWSRKIPGVRERMTPVGVDWAALPRIDAVLISHNHYDHLDGPTIRRLPRDTPLLVPGNLGRWFRRRGFSDVTDLDWWESRTIGGVTFEFVPAHHWSRRTLTDTNKSLWGGWVLTAEGQPAPNGGQPTPGQATPGQAAGGGTGGSAPVERRSGARIYFAGDTGYGHWFGEIARRHPGIDLALLPVGAYEPNWFMRPVHMNPEEAVRACVELGATRMATMHWGTFLLSAEPILEPVEKSIAAWTAAGRPREDLWDLAVGESRGIGPGGTDGGGNSRALVDNETDDRARTA